MGSLAAAVQFLTILPIRLQQPVPLGRAAALFPFVGAALGAAGAGLFWILSQWVPASIASLLVVCFWVAVTGGLHEDGLADIADAVRAGRSRERMLAILKDSRVGAFGAMAIALSIFLRWQSLQLLATPRWVAAIIASQALSRAAIVALAWISRPMDSGLGFTLASSLHSGAALIALAQGAIVALTCGWRPGLVLILGSYAIVRLARGWFHARLGGINGDCLGATAQVVEIFVLLVFACRECSW